LKSEESFSTGTKITSLSKTLAFQVQKRNYQVVATPACSYEHYELSPDHMQAIIIQSFQ